MVRVKVQIMNYQAEVSKISGLKKTIDRRIQSIMKFGGLTLKSMLSTAAPKDTGKLSKSFKFRTNSNGAGFEVYSDDPKISIVTDGSKPHVIRPRSKKAMFWPGAFFPVKKVNHPGTKPNNFVSRVLAEFKAKILEDIQRQFGGDK